MAGRAYNFLGSANPQDIRLYRDISDRPARKGYSFGEINVS